MSNCIFKIVCAANMLFVATAPAQQSSSPQQRSGPQAESSPPSGAPQLKSIKVYLIGDSTMSNKEVRFYPETGWGMPFAYFFDSSVTVDNRAKNGRSTKTFLSEGLWRAVADDLKEGDYVFIQFGHNDAGTINDTSRARASLPGIGEDTQEIDNQVTHKHEVVHSYGWYLRKMILDTKGKGATPIGSTDRPMTLPSTTAIRCCRCARSLLIKRLFATVRCK